MSFFQKYSCGCIGIPIEPETLPSGAKRDCVIVIHCDVDRDELPGLVWFLRDMSEKTFEEISAEEEAKLHRQLADQLSAGQALDQVRMMLGITSVEANLRNTERRLDEKIDVNFGMLNTKYSGSK